METAQKEVVSQDDDSESQRDEQGSSRIESSIIFITSNISKKENQKVVVKHLWANNFRVNFFESKFNSDEDLFKTHVIAESRFIEIIETGDGNMEIVDKTAVPSKKGISY